MRWVLVLGAAALTLQWILVPLPGAPQRTSVVVALLMAGTALLRCSPDALRDVLRTTWPFVVGWAALVVVWVATDLFHAVSPRIAVQQGVQLAVLVGVATLVLTLAGRRDAVALMRWTGAIGTAVLVAALWFSLAANQVDAVAVVGEAVAAGDPNVLQTQIFRDGLVGLGFEAADLLSNIRHEIFAALLVCLYLGETAIRMQPFTSRTAKVVTRVALVVAVVLVVLSLSRSVTIALVLWPLLAGARAWQRREVTRRQLAGLAGLAVAVVLAAASGVGGFLLTRFSQDTTSYDKRGTLVDTALRDILANPVTGGFDTRGASSHNVVLDSWLRAGLPGALLAAAVSAVLIVLWVSLALRLGREPAWLVPVVAALGLVLVRMFTAGGGTLPPVEWVALGVVAGFMAHRARLTGARAEEPGPVDAGERDEPAGSVATRSAVRGAAAASSRPPVERSSL